MNLGGLIAYKVLAGDVMNARKRDGRHVGVPKLTKMAAYAKKSWTQGQDSSSDFFKRGNKDSSRKGAPDGFEPEIP